MTHAGIHLREEQPSLWTVVFDARPRMTACKCAVQGKLVLDHLLSGCHRMITPQGEEAVAVLGARSPDGVVAGERMAWGTLQVVPVAARPWVPHLTADAVGDGEQETRELCGQGAEGEALGTEDSLAGA